MVEACEERKFPYAYVTLRLFCDAESRRRILVSFNEVVRKADKIISCFSFSTFSGNRIHTNENSFTFSKESVA